MTKTVTTISIDADVKEEGKKFLKAKGFSFSFYVEQELRKFIEENKREVKQDGIFRKEE